jgi:hypothetical protein
MRRPDTSARALLALAALAILLPTSASATFRKLQVFGLTADQQLIRFREDRVRSHRAVGPVTNLSGDTSLLGIDFRPANGALYALGNAGGIYTLDVETAEATFVSQLNLNGQPLALSGASFGIDFNPTVDRLRVVSDTGQNLRINVDTGAATVDGGLNFPGVAPAPTTPATGVTAVAYTNNDADAATGTTLFDLDSANDQVVIQLPPNAGNLTPTGKLGQDVAPDGGFDIWSDVDESGRSVAVRALAALTTDASRLYEIDLLTGQATNLGRFRGDTRVIGLAIALDAN